MSDYIYCDRIEVVTAEAGCGIPKFLNISGSYYSFYILSLFGLVFSAA